MKLLKNKIALLFASLMVLQTGCAHQTLDPEKQAERNARFEAFKAKRQYEHRRSMSKSTAPQSWNNHCLAQGYCNHNNPTWKQKTPTNNGPIRKSNK